MNLIHIIWMLGGALLGGVIGFLLASVLKIQSESQKEQVKTILICVLAFGGAFVMPALFGTSKRDDTALTPQAPIRNDAVASDIVASIALLDNVLLKVLSRKNPAVRQEIDSQYQTGRGPKSRVDEYTVTKGVSHALAYVPYASDQSLLDLVEGLAVSTKALLSKDAKACYGWLYGFYGHEDFDYPRFASALGDNLLAYQFSVYAQMVESAGEDRISYDKGAAQASVSRVSFQFIQAAGFQKSGLLTGEAPPSGQEDYEAACQARYVLYQALLREENAADAIRELFGQGG